MNYDPTDKRNSMQNQDSIKQSKEDRDMDGFTWNKQTGKVILKPDEVATQGWSYPASRIGTKKINGEPVEVTEYIYRYDALGREVRNDDIVGFSWTGIPIPHDMHAWCLNPFDLHEGRQIFITIDGVFTDKFNFLCLDCMKINDDKTRRIIHLLTRICTFGIFNYPRIY